MVVVHFINEEMRIQSDHGTIHERESERKCHVACTVGESYIRGSISAGTTRFKAACVRRAGASFFNGNLLSREGDPNNF